MTEPAEPFRSPYPSTPGSSTPGPEVGPAEGRAELWRFVRLSVLNTVIIAVGGLAAWFYLHH